MAKEGNILSSGNVLGTWDKPLVLPVLLVKSLAVVMWPENILAK